ncbi:DUF5522 domain-containing protein [Niabella insulamsoli]|uniref:DUF5522 domain-containing protein n=1 Tax=Niabella insulamsoli TaxID=3144874 RepID=UPI0031FCDB17
MNWIEGEHYYINPSGLVVLTERFLRERGYCCGSGCRHCPFDYIKVPEPKRSLLRHERNQKEKE